MVQILSTMRPLKNQRAPRAKENEALLCRKDLNHPPTAVDGIYSVYLWSNTLLSRVAAFEIPIEGKAKSNDD